MNAIEKSPKEFASPRSLTISKNFFVELIGALSLFLVYELVYIFIEYPIFSYVGYTFSFNYWRFVLGWVLYIVSFVVLYSSKDTMSNIFLYLYYFISVTPTIVLYQFDTTKLWMVMYQLVFMWLIKFLVCAFEKLPQVRFTLSRKGVDLATNKVVWLFIIGFAGYLLVKNGIPSLSSISFENISETRAQAEFSLIMTLLMNLICKILIPLMISAMYDKKKWFSLIIICLVQVYIYAITGFKTFLLIPVLVLGAKFLRGKSMKKILMFGLLAAFAASFVIFFVIRSNMFAAIVFNRLVFLPAKIKFAYFDFFSTHEYIYFSQSSIASILGIPSNYPINVMYLIGGEYFNDPNMWTNTGFLADAYSNGGFLAGAFVSLVLAIELYLLNVAIKNPMKNSASVMFLIFFIALNDGGLISVSISGGFLFAILLVYLTKTGEHT